MADRERRRSDRLMLTIPLRVMGVDDKGRAFEYEGRTFVINRHGARIQLARLLRRDQVVRLVNLITLRGGNFRVVGPTEAYSETGGEWGLEGVDSKLNIWGIQFPAPPEPRQADSRALLECRNCHTVALLPVSLVEVDVLGSAGIISKLCEQCGPQTPWGYTEKQVAMEGPPGEEAMVRQAQAQVEAKGAEQRRHRRVSLQLPVLVRDYYGGVEITQSENVSKGGFCFVSEKTYHLGEGVMAVCPYHPTGQNIEIRARIVRRREIEGSQRKVYGVRYEPQVH